MDKACRNNNQTGLPPMRLGIFGGSFNPIHKGHLQAIRIFMHRLQLDQVVLVPALEPFYKETRCIDFAHRYAMCRLAVQPLPGAGVSDVEKRCSGPAYTYSTLGMLLQEYAGADCFLLMGSDVYQRMPLWKGLDEILAAASIAVLHRNTESADSLRQTTQALLEKRARIVLLNEPMPPVSSTMIRQAVQQGEPATHLLPEAVAQYIRSHGLYG